MTYTPLDSPESIPTRFAEAWNRRDPDTLAALFDEDAEFVNVTGLWWHDRDAIRRAHAYGLERIFNRSTLSLERVRVKWLSGEIAVVHARMRLEGQTPVGGVTNPKARRTLFSFVVHRAGEEWRCASAHNTDIVPGMETNLIDDEGRFMSVDYRRGLTGRPLVGGVTMETNDPAATVERMFAAFGAGDLDALLDTVHPKSRWLYYGANPGLSQAEFQGRERVRRFFERILSRLEMTDFNPGKPLVQGDTVVYFGNESGTVRATGQPFKNEWVQKYVVRDNLIVEMVEYNIQVEPRP